MLTAAKGLAAHQHTSVGKIISSLVRQVLQSEKKQVERYRNGVPLLPVRSDALVVTPELVNELL